MNTHPECEYLCHEKFVQQLSILLVVGGNFLAAFCFYAGFSNLVCYLSAKKLIHSRIKMSKAKSLEMGRGGIYPGEIRNGMQTVPSMLLILDCQRT